MKISDWNEVSDSYVDGELSEEEMSQVSARAETDDALREEIEWASELHKRLVRVAREGRPVPDGFSERLRNALDASPAWAQYGGAIETRKTEYRASRRVVPVVVAACVVVAVVAASVAGIVSLRKPVDSPTNGDGIAQTNVDGATSIASPSFETTPRIMTPSPEGNAPESAAIKPSQSQLWTVVSFNDETRLKKRIFEFQQSCKKQGVAFKKFGGDREFVLERVKPSQWRVVLDELAAEATAVVETSEALEKWGAAKDEIVKTKNLRVTFDATSVVEPERMEE